MELIWSEPLKHPNTVNPFAYSFPARGWDKAIIGWLNYSDVWPQIDRDHWELSYNYVWHFFDISIFECHLPGHGSNPRQVIEAMERYLSSTDLQWSTHLSSRWDTREDGTRWSRPGARFFVHAVDHPASTPPIDYCHP